ncbi:MAG: transposase [bacterium]
MTRKPRGIFEVGYYYHILNRGNNKNNIFKYAEDKGFFQDRFFQYLDDFYVQPINFCIMNNHFHTEIYINDKSNVSEFMRSLCTSFAMYYNKKYPHTGHVFQDRYVSKQLFTDAGVLNVYNYIRNNPVKAGLSAIPEDYAWLWEARTVLDRVLDRNNYPHIPLPPNFPLQLS